MFRRTLTPEVIARKLAKLGMWAESVTLQMVHPPAAAIYVGPDRANMEELFMGSSEAAEHLARSLGIDGSHTAQIVIYSPEPHGGKSGTVNVWATAR